MKIHKDTACQALKGPCQAKCDGASTRDVNTSKLYIFVNAFIIFPQQREVEIVLSLRRIT